VAWRQDANNPGSPKVQAVNVYRPEGTPDFKPAMAKWSDGMTRQLPISCKDLDQMNGGRLPSKMGNECVFEGQTEATHHRVQVRLKTDRKPMCSLYEQGKQRMQAHIHLFGDPELQTSKDRCIGVMVCLAKEFCSGKVGRCDLQQRRNELLREAGVQMTMAGGPKAVVNKKPSANATDSGKVSHEIKKSGKSKPSHEIEKSGRSEPSDQGDDAEEPEGETMEKDSEEEHPEEDEEQEPEDEEADEQKLKDEGQEPEGETMEESSSGPLKRLSASSPSGPCKRLSSSSSSGPCKRPSASSSSAMLLPIPPPPASSMMEQMLETARSSGKHHHHHHLLIIIITDHHLNIISSSQHHLNVSTSSSQHHHHHHRIILQSCHRLIIIIIISTSAS